MEIFSNDWMNWLFSTYSIAIMCIPSVIGFVLKLIAVFHPGVPSDKIIDLIKEYWPKGKGP